MTNKPPWGEFVGTHQEDTVPRFYFDVWLGNHVTRDDTGLLLASPSAEEDEAIKAAAGIGHDGLPRSRVSEILVRVRGDDDYTVFTVVLAMNVRRIKLTHV